VTDESRQPPAFFALRYAAPAEIDKARAPAHNDLQYFFQQQQRFIFRERL
jgi:hypothetical protein